MTNQQGVSEGPQLGSASEKYNDVADQMRTLLSRSGSALLWLLWGYNSTSGTLGG
jgi:hypothetical protein